MSEHPVKHQLLITIAFAALSFSSIAGQAERATDLGAWSSRGADIDRGRAVVVGAFVGQSGTNAGGLDPRAAACFQCHGMDGKGDAAAAFPRLTDQVYKYLYDSLKDYSSGARQNPVMTPIAQALGDQQMRDVSAYYAAQSNVDYGRRQHVSPELIVQGGAIAAIGNAPRGVQGCINCHGPEGVGLPPTYPFLAGQHQVYLEAQLRAWKSGERKGDFLGIMENIAKRLSEEEIQAVSAYYASIRPHSVTPEEPSAAPMSPLPAVPAQMPGR